MRRFSLVLSALLLATRAFALDITAPGAVVPSNQTGIVQTDLLCDPPGVGVHLEVGATLSLNGHVLDGCSVSAVTSPPRAARANVVGPGEIRNASYGIALGGGTIRVRDVLITDPVVAGILGTTEAGVRSTAKLANVTVTGSGGDGVRVTKVKARDVTVSGNAGEGIVGFGGVSGRNVVAANNGQEGVFTAAGRLALVDSQVTGNALSGVIGFAVSLTRSTATGNGGGGGFDVVSVKPPKVRSSTCGTSSKSDLTGTWGVCTND